MSTREITHGDKYVLNVPHKPLPGCASAKNSAPVIEALQFTQEDVQFKRLVVFAGDVITGASGSPVDSLFIHSYLGDSIAKVGDYLLKVNGAVFHCVKESFEKAYTKLPVNKNVNLYRKKPVVVEAILWDGNNVQEMYEFLSGKQVESPRHVPLQGDNFYVVLCNGGCVVGDLYIKTLAGDNKANIGDYIIKGVAGEFYPCKPAIFEATYTKES